MNREIKFRMWHPGLKRMVPSEELVADQMALLADGRFANIHSANTKLSYIYSHEQMRPLQYTGLKDRLGIEIYEGDVLESDHGTQFVRWNSAQACFGMCFNVNTATTSIPSRVVVIGNIYEDPELVEKENLIVKEQGEATGFLNHETPPIASTDGATDGF